MPDVTWYVAVCHGCLNEQTGEPIALPFPSPAYRQEWVDAHTAALPDHRVDTHEVDTLTGGGG